MLCVQGISNDVKNTRETLLHQMGVGTMVTHARKIQLPACVHASHGLRGSASITEGLAARRTEQSRPRRSPSPSDPPELTHPEREQTCRLPPAASHVGTVSTKAALAPAARERAQRRAVSVKLRPRCRQSAAGGPGPGRRPRCTRRLHALLPCEAHSSTANASTAAGRLLYYLSAHVRSIASPRRDRRGSTSLTKRHKPPVCRVRWLHVLMSALMPPLLHPFSLSSWTWTLTLSYTRSPGS